jgi:hypothetical protein
MPVSPVANQGVTVAERQGAGVPAARAGVL